MNTTEQRTAIAEACGWKWVENGPERRVWWSDSDSDVMQTSYWLCSDGEVRNDYENFDYLNDLNAIHEAEKVLTNEQLHTYVSILRRIVERDELQGRGRSYICIGSTAQRAEAFLKTLNLWKDTK